MTTSAAESLWLDTAPATAYPRSRRDAGDRRRRDRRRHRRPDDRAAAQARAARGSRCSRRRGVGSGVTGCTTAKVTALQATVLSQIRRRHGAEAAAAYAEASAGRASSRSATLAARGGHRLRPRAPPGRSPTRPSEQERAAVEAEAEAAQAAGLPVELVDDAGPAVSGRRRRAPRRPAPAAPRPLRPRARRRGRRRRLARASSARARSASSDGAPCRVRDHRRRRSTAEHVVVATHYPLLDRGLFFARLEPKRSYCVAARVRGAPPRGMSISAGSPTRSMRSYGDLLIVGGEGHATGAREATPERYERARGRSRASTGTCETSPTAGRRRTRSPYDHLPVDRPLPARLLAAVGRRRLHEVGPDERRRSPR